MRGAAAGTVLEVRDLAIGFPAGHGTVRAVDGVSFSVAAGETLAIVGESGCGKTVTGLSLLGLLPRSAQVGGSIRLEGAELVGLPSKEMRQLRGRRVAMVFQDPMSALNPVHTIGAQIVEALRAHRSMSRTTARRRAEELLQLVRIPEPARRMKDYPHRLSGGMRQRVVIALALAGDPILLVADEPTTALDVTIQAQILRLLVDIQRALGMAMILITHDLGVVAETADRVLVMYAGRKVEEQNVHDLFARPLHPYTQGLLAAKPRPAPETGPRRPLTEIPGLVPNPAAMPAGCAFAPRCPRADVDCTAARPALHWSGAAGVACYKPGPPALGEVA
ncbi:MAG TPA: ABC transporter ATP-binding protein [Stellaceae bacterium]|nr:ABC transporter ATP-binding protein [Stellaceae bacterium]